MQHALRFHLEERTRREDPARYTRLSERLEEILRELSGRFEEQIEEFGSLIEQARQEDEEDPALAGLSLMEKRMYRLLDQLLDDNPGIRRPIPNVRSLVGPVCEVAKQVMRRASYQGLHQDRSVLASYIQDQLMEGGLRTATQDLVPLRNIAEQVMTFAAENRSLFLASAGGR